jgi:hypothetical protein
MKAQKIACEEELPRDGDRAAGFVNRTQEAGLLPEEIVGGIVPQ